MILFLAFILVPLIEIALFIQIGGGIGLWPTLAIVVLTAMLGTWLVRNQGRQALHQVQSSFERADNPAEPLAHGAMILVAGILLLTPGFFTDAIGFALLTPPVRVATFKYIKARLNVQSFPMGSARSAHGAETIDGEWEEVHRPRDPDAPPSGWTKPDQRH